MDILNQEIENEKIDLLPADSQAATTALDQQQSRELAFKSAIKAAEFYEPNKFAQALKVEREKGIPATAAYDNWNTVEQAKKYERLNGLFSQAPRTADALAADPKRAIVAQGDEENLKRMEEALSRAKFYEQGFFEREILNSFKTWAKRDTLADVPGRLIRLDRIESDFDRIDAGEKVAGGDAFLYAEADHETRKQMRADLQVERNLALDRAAVAGYELSQIPTDPAAAAFEKAEGAGEALGVVADNPAFLGRIALQSAPDMVQSVLLGLINPLLAGVSEGSIASNQRFVQLLQEKGIDPADRVQLLQALRNDDLVSELRERSARYGAGIGAVSTISMGLLGRTLAPTSVGGNALTTAQREWINAGVQVPVQGLLEATGEATGQFAERFDTDDLDSKEILLEGLVGSAMAAPMAGVFAGKRATEHMINAQRAERAARVQSDLVAGAMGSTTRQNDPATFEAIVSAQLSGRPNEYIEIPAAKLQELNQSGLVNLPELLENVGVKADHFTAQVELDGTIRIKNSSYLAYLADHDELLRSSIRVANNQYSLDDIAEFDAQLIADLERTVEDFGKVDPLADAYTDAMGQLLNAGYERSTADVTARQYAAVMTRLAEQSGQTVQELMAANPLRIGRDLPQQVRKVKGSELTLMLSRLRAGDVPTERQASGPSLLEFISKNGGLTDDGGELAAFDIDAGRVGHNRIVRKDGLSPDDAVTMAWEQGYFPGMELSELTPDLLVQSLRDELAGRPRYSVAQEDETLAAQAQQLNELAEYLDQLGVDLESVTDEEVLELLSAVEGETLNQSVLPETITVDGIERPTTNANGQSIYPTLDGVESFWRWFGDSKVVDDQGRPLVVYHGTARDFGHFDNKKTGSNDKGLWGRGHYFTSSTDVANSYASRQGDGAQVIPAYIAIGNPLILKTDENRVTLLPDGRNYRELLGRGLDGSKIKDIAREAGHDGVVQIKADGQIGDVAAYDGQQIKSAIGNQGTFSAESPSILEQSGDDDARGSITFGPRVDGVRAFDIRIGKKADFSTVLHEMGHFYLEVIGDLVADGKASDQLTADYQAIRTWLGAEDGQPLTVDQHEYFARGFEKYLAEGKAPSIELQSAFARFKRWMIAVYRDLTALNVELSDSVRGVFDRLLASQDAIAEAEQALALSQEYESSITALMTPDEAANYARVSQQARDEAVTEIEQEVLQAERRKHKAWYREEKSKVEAEVKADLEQSQPYQSRKFLFTDAPHPDLGKPLRLDSAAVTALFGSKTKEARFLGRARVREGGMHPDMAASLLGYDNPTDMLLDMMAVPSLNEAVKQETERRMAERYPDLATDGTLVDRAMFVAAERDAEAQAIQYRALARQAGRNASQHRIIKEAARQIIQRTKLRDAMPGSYERASAKAAREVERALLAGDVAVAYEAKERQLLNLHLYKEAVKAQELAKKKVDIAKSYTKKGAKRKRLQEASTQNFEVTYPDGRVEYVATKAVADQAEEQGAAVQPLYNFLEQVDALLQRYEFGTPRKIIRQQRETLAQFLASLADQGLVVNPAEWVLLDRAQRTNWRDLTIEQLEGVVDMIRQIDQLAKNKLGIIRDDKWLEFEPLRDAIAATVQLNGGKARDSNFNKSFGDELRRWGREWLGQMPADQIAATLDGYDDLGPVQANITTPVQQAARNAVIREKLESQGLADLLKQFYTEEQLRGMNDVSKAIAIPEIGDSLTKMQLVMLLANLGNEGNRTALMSEARGIWTAETMQAAVSRLDSNDADFVEALWAWIDKFWPEIAESEKRRTGVEPKKVEGDQYPVRLSDGKIRVLKGGYFPLKYDGDLSIKTSQDEVGEAFKNMTSGRAAKAHTPDGHKMERVGSGGRPVKLDFTVVTSHLNEIVRDLTMADAVNTAWRFLHDREVQSAFERANLKELFTGLEIWMQDTAEGEKVDGGYATAAARWLRVGFTANVMLFNLANSLLNVAGVHPAVVLGKRWALAGYKQVFKKSAWDQMFELSSFMREARIESYNKDLSLVQERMAGKGGWRQTMTTIGFWLHNKTQMWVDAATWMGAYQKGISMDLTGADLVTYADQRVVEVSGSGVFGDRSALERGTLSRQTRQNELVRGLTTLAGYMMRKIAIARKRTAETNFKDVGQAMSWAVDMALLFTVEGLLYAFMKGNTPDDDDEDQALEWAKSAAWETFASAGGGLPPFGRPVVASLQGFGGGSSSVDIFAEQFGNAVSQVKQGEADVTLLKSIIMLTGTATKTPGLAVNRVIDYVDRSKEGEVPPWYELFTGNRDK